MNKNFIALALATTLVACGDQAPTSQTFNAVEVLTAQCQEGETIALSFDEVHVIAVTWEVPEGESWGVPEGTAQFTPVSWRKSEDGELHVEQCREFPDSWVTVTYMYL